MKEYLCAGCGKRNDPEKGVYAIGTGLYFYQHFVGNKWVDIDGNSDLGEHMDCPDAYVMKSGNILNTIFMPIQEK